MGPARLLKRKEGRRKATCPYLCEMRNFMNRWPHILGHVEINGVGFAAKNMSE